MSEQPLKLATLCLHGGQVPDPATNARGRIKAQDYAVATLRTLVPKWAKAGHHLERRRIKQSF